MIKVDLKNVSLNYPIICNNNSIRRAFFDKFKKRNIYYNSAIQHVTALKNITFNLKSGDRLGIQGENGAGKSTLLRVIGGIYHPSNGNLIVQGRISSLLDIFFGVNNDATGRENILIRCYLLNLKPHDTYLLSKKVIDFIDIGKFIDLPIKTYSTGMKMRLAFGISVFIKSDILLMDEWLSVGDKEFVEKAERQLLQTIKRTGIFLFASHNEKQLRKLCNKILKLEHGKIISFKEI